MSYLLVLAGVMVVLLVIGLIAAAIYFLRTSLKLLRWIPAVAVVVLVGWWVWAWQISPSGKTGKKVEAPRVAEPERAALAKCDFATPFLDGANQLVFDLRPDRAEGVMLPLDAVAYDITPSKWHQIITWEGKVGPIVRKGQPAYMPIPRNRHVSAATFCIRGEGEVTITIERKTPPSVAPPVETPRLKKA